MKLFVVGRFNGKAEVRTRITGVPRWDILGIFDDEDEAKRNCFSTHDFVRPMVLNKYIGDDSELWPGCYYPIKHKE